jgi:hypothetical protein
VQTSNILLAIRREWVAHRYVSCLGGSNFGNIIDNFQISPLLREIRGSHKDADKNAPLLGSEVVLIGTDVPQIQEELDASTFTSL